MPLFGDLVFKLNLGPVDNNCLTTISRQGICSTRTTFSTHNTKNPNAAPRNTNNLINWRPSCKTGFNLRKQMVLCNINARSVRNKTAVIFYYICERKVDLVALTEHWLTDSESAVRAELCPDGYSILDHLRHDRPGGGTGIIYRNSLDVSKVYAGVFEFSGWIVKSPPHNMRLIIIYRPPYSEDHLVPTSVFLSEFAEYLETLLLCKEELLITGDFNIHIDDPQDSCARKFLEFLLLDGLGLKQHVHQPTHREGHTLDPTTTRVSEILIVSTPMVDQFISDHAAVLCWLAEPRLRLSVKTICH